MSERPFHLRLLGPDDAEIYFMFRLLALVECPDAFCASFEAESARPIEWFRERLTPDELSFTVGAFENENLVGAVGFRRNEGEKTRHAGFLWGMYVMPNSRGIGVGDALMRDVIARASELPGLLRVTLSVTTTRDDAWRLYRRHGFESYGLEKDALYVGDAFYDLDHMTLTLRPLQTSN